ncbi:MAG: hypothetical protein H0U28_07545 [Nocardioidaceae bacterium]|nr:hypothetical protein [Nocardioidaceae bacterium]
MSYPEYPANSSNPGTAGQQGVGHSAQGHPAHQPDARRPWTVLVGCILAWVGGALGVFLSAFAFTRNQDSEILDDLPAGTDRGDALAAIQAGAGVLLVWCLIVLVLAFFAFRGVRWAAIALLVLAGLVALAVLLNLLLAGSSAGIPILAWSVASAVLIYRTPASKDWFDVRAAAR